MTEVYWNLHSPAARRPHVAPRQPSIMIATTGLPPTTERATRGIINAASRALSVLAVFDEPDGRVREPASSVILGLAQPEPCPFASTRHSSLIFSIAASVV